LDAGARGSQGNTAAAFQAVPQEDMGQFPIAIAMRKILAQQDLQGPKVNPEWLAKPE